MTEATTIAIELPPLKLDREAIAKRLRVPATSRKREELWEMIDTIEQKAKPAVYFRQFTPVFNDDGTVSLAETRIESAGIAKMLGKKGQPLADGAPTVFAFAATCGQEASDWGNEREMGLPVFWAQTILEEGMLLLQAELERELKKIGDNEVSYLEPGIPEDWPLDKQETVFELLGGNSETFGIRLNNQSLMLPFRYLAGLAYFTKKLLPQCGICHFTDCNKQRGGCWRLQAIKRKGAETGREVEETQE
ncbi:MAG: hypothetical protein HDQ44_04815 [Desulfovibrio sp.]|nr:hypothetical protein [Desulfovibrio sp.]